MNKKKTIIGIAIALAALLIMGYIEQVVAPAYLIKSIIKVFLFLGTILLYKIISKEKLKDIIRFNKMRPAKILYFCMGIAYIGIILLFVILRNHLDLQNIKNSLVSKEQLTRENCLFIFSYIMICNSFLEEAFFRGFIFHLFESLKLKKLGYVFGGLSFALYHIGMVSNWFNLFIFIFCIAGLAVVGMILQFISCKYDSLKASWLIHGCANFAINTIGAILIFGL